MRGRSLWKGFQVSLYTWIRDLLKYFLYSTPYLLGSETVLSRLSQEQEFTQRCKLLYNSCSQIQQVVIGITPASLSVSRKQHLNMEQATFFDLAESRAIKKKSFIRINRKGIQALALK